MKADAPKRESRAQSGQTLVEMALLTPLLLAMVLGAIEFGRYSYLAILVGNAARAGAAYATDATHASDTNAVIQAAKNDYQNNGQQAALLTVTVSYTCGCDNGTYPMPTLTCLPGVGGTAPSCPSGSHYAVLITVTASGTYNSLFNYPWIPKSITIKRSATIRAPLN
jgi:Flp pilus assembly protein TadG